MDQTVPSVPNGGGSALSLNAIEPIERETIKRVTWRLMPLLMLGYFCAYLDRSNVGMAATTMVKSLGFTNAVFGFGAGLFVKDGRDRYGLAAGRPAALVDMPKFNGDDLDAGRSGGDLCIQACANDPQVAFHAVRQLARISYGAASLKWVQSGFSTANKTQGTPRNLMGFKDGTQNPAGAELDQVVWVGDEGPDWMRGGSYQAVRRIRIALEHWDRTEVDFQEQVVGRHKYSGAPLGLKV